MRARRASTKALRSVFAPSIAPGRSEGQAARERRASEFLRQFEERRQNRRMQVKCLCAVTWSSVRPVARKASNWARTSARICLRTWGGKTPRRLRAPYSPETGRASTRSGTADGGSADSASTIHPSIRLALRRTGGSTQNPRRRFSQKSCTDRDAMVMLWVRLCDDSCVNGRDTHGRDVWHARLLASARNRWRAAKRRLPRMR
jgi:hypothetical protein